jgi:hypothetical protein
VSSGTAFGGLTADQWDSLAGSHFYSSSGWLRFCATDYGSPGDAVVVFDGDEPVCAVPTAAAGDLPAWSRYDWNGALAERGLPRIAGSGLLVGSREGYQANLLSGSRAPATDAVAELIGELRHRTGADRACIAMYLTSDDALALHRAGVTAPPVLLDVDAWIRIPDGGWDAWLESLSANRRRMVRQDVRKFDEAGHTVSHAKLADHYRDLGELAAATLNRYGFRTEPETELAALENHAKTLPEDATVALCRTAAGEIAGFCLYYSWRGTVFVRWVGFDYELLRDASEYFNLMYYSTFHRGVETGAQWLHAGIGNIVSKAFRGAELRPLWLVELSGGAALANAAEKIRQHNTELHRQYADNPKTAPNLVSSAQWDLGGWAMDPA